MAATDLTENMAVELLAQIGAFTTRIEPCQAEFVLGGVSFMWKFVDMGTYRYEIYKQKSEEMLIWDYISSHSCLFWAVEMAVSQLEKGFGIYQYRLSICPKEFKWRVVIEDAVNLLTWHVYDDRLVGLLAESICGGEDATKILGDYVQDLQLG